jgi:hypothetical protein
MLFSMSVRLLLWSESKIISSAVFNLAGRVVPFGELPIVVSSRPAVKSTLPFVPVALVPLIA